MSSVAMWYRVMDPLNPLCGADVLIEDEGDNGFCVVTALRRLDVLMGNRTFQLRVPEGQHLGISVLAEHLVESPIQDDVIEIAYDYPNGKCLSEATLDTGDTDELRIARYERAIQVAYGEREGELAATCTLRGDDREERLKTIIGLFEDSNFDFDNLIAAMRRENH